MASSDILTPQLQADLLAFTRALVRIQSYSGQEEAIIRFLQEKMLALGYEEVTIDSMGNLLGRIGTGGKSLLLDSHVDTVAAQEAALWSFPPFSGEVVDGRLCGRGSVDMKSGLAASVYAGALARDLGFTSGKTLYVSCTVFEEDCDGVNLKHLFHERRLRPDAAVICEPSNNQIALGHKGKAQIIVRTHGVSAHGSAPEKGQNAIYEMAEIIRRTEQANREMKERDGLRPTLAMTSISSQAASLNAIPFACEAYLDRRLVPGETEEDLREEMERLLRGTNAEWHPDTLHRTSWTGLEITYEPLAPAWKIGLETPLAQSCLSAYRQVFGAAPSRFAYWDFSTNAITPVRLGIPTIGFGPGDPKLAHMRDESIPVEQILDACRFYVQLIRFMD